MELIVKGKNMDVPPAIKEYVSNKIGRLERFLEDQIMSAEVEFSAEKNPSIATGQTVEVTIYTKGPLIRAKETSVDMHASIDRVLDKLERQIKRYKNKVYSSAAAGRHGNSKHPPAGAPLMGGEPGIVRVKQVEAKPMTREEAALQMDLLGHDFFVFTNPDTDEINVVYKRRDRGYGVIEPL